MLEFLLKDPTVRPVSKFRASHLASCQVPMSCEQDLRDLGKSISEKLGISSIASLLQTDA